MPSRGGEIRYAVIFESSSPPSPCPPGQNPTTMFLGPRDGVVAGNPNDQCIGTQHGNTRFKVAKVYFKEFQMQIYNMKVCSSCRLITRYLGEGGILFCCACKVAGATLYVEGDYEHASRKLTFFARSLGAHKSTSMSSKAIIKYIIFSIQNISDSASVSELK